MPRVATTIAAILASLGLPAALPGTASATVVPVVRCPTTFGVAGQTHSAPAQLDVRAPASTARGLAAYTNTGAYLLGPAGMRCSGILAADGGSQVLVWPQAQRRPGPHSHGAGIVLTIDPACASCRAEDACPFLRALARGLGFPCTSGVPAGERVDRLSSSLVLFEDPPGVSGSGSPSGGADPANGVVGTTGTARNRSVYRSTCTLPSSEHSLCTTILDDVIARYG
jgi:hypothetical protein